MRKYILTIAFLLIFAASMIGWPLMARGASDTVTFSADTNLYLWDANQTLTVSSGSTAAGLTVYGEYINIDLENGSSITVVSPNKYVMNADPNIATTTCTAGGSTSTITLTSTTTQTVKLTPSTGICTVPSSGGGGGGGGGGGVTTTTTTTTVPTTTTGQVTATASGGGKTTLTTSENATASVDLPANAVTASTDVKIVTETKSNVITNQPVPSGQSIVGGYVFNLTATSGTTIVTTFSKNITLTFVYTNTQITGLNEDTLKIYYWNGSQWVALSTIVDKANNKLTAVTTHFTYFAMMGEAGVTPTPGMAKPEDYGLKEGDLIRAQGDFDIFIINQLGYKRLFLNPAIFNMYGHLTGGWAAVKTVTTATRDAFVTSTHYRYVNEDKVYHLTVTGEDTGTLHWINMTAENFSAQGGTANAIFTINKSELDWYPKGADKTSL